jgi:hypothetical protein
MKRNQPVAPVSTIATTNLNVTASTAAATTANATATSVRFTQTASATNVVVGYPESLSLLIDSDGAVIREAMLNGSWNRFGDTVNIFSPTNSVL